MELTSENLPAIKNVSEADIERAFADGSLGRHAQIRASEECAISAACKGTPSNCVPPDHPEVKGHWEFIRRTGTEPWYMEYVDSGGVRECPLESYFTLEQVKQTFIGFLGNDPSWRRAYSWVPVTHHPWWTREFDITEDEWKSFKLSITMLDLLRPKASEVNFRRFMIACCRRIWTCIVDERLRNAVEVAELDVEGRLGDDERNGAARSAALALAEASERLDIRRGNGHLYHAAWAAAICAYTPEVPLETPRYKPELAGAYDCAVNVAINSAYAGAIAKVHGIESKAELHDRVTAETDAEYAAQCDLVREIFGYPFGTTPIPSG
jgi:hypothetical protein